MAGSDDPAAVFFLMALVLYKERGSYLFAGMKNKKSIYIRGTSVICLPMIDVESRCLCGA